MSACIGDRRGREENGQILPLVCLFVMLAAGAMFFIGQLGLAAAERAHARTAADAAALAGALDGKDAALEVARSNRARLVVYGENNDEVRVVVVFRDARARATARRSFANGGLEAVCNKRPELPSCR